eukprot:m.247701 g.247701  ORF g.247701 m.247701 type:complete len:428 (-) comp15466_c0_seq1:291-1574(-)
MSEGAVGEAQAEQFAFLPGANGDQHHADVPVPLVMAGVNYTLATLWWRALRSPQGGSGNYQPVRWAIMACDGAGSSTLANLLASDAELNLGADIGHGPSPGRDHNTNTRTIALGPAVFKHEHLMFVLHVPDPGDAAAQYAQDVDYMQHACAAQLHAIIIVYDLSRGPDVQRHLFRVVKDFEPHVPRMLVIFGLPTADVEQMTITGFLQRNDLGHAISADLRHFLTELSPENAAHRVFFVPSRADLEQDRLPVHAVGVRHRILEGLAELASDPIPRQGPVPSTTQIQEQLRDPLLLGMSPDELMELMEQLLKRGGRDPSPDTCTIISFSTTHDAPAKYFRAACNHLFHTRDRSVVVGLTHVFCPLCAKGTTMTHQIDPTNQGQSADNSGAAQGGGIAVHRQGGDAAIGNQSDVAIASALESTQISDSS